LKLLLVFEKLKNNFVFTLSTDNSHASLVKLKKNISHIGPNASLVSLAKFSDYANPSMANLVQMAILERLN
jgi:hypothetical protein